METETMDYSSIQDNDQYHDKDVNDIFENLSEGLKYRTISFGGDAAPDSTAFFGFHRFLKKTFPLKFHLIFEVDLPDKSFLVDGIEHNVPCIFQIWEKKSHSRFVAEKIEPLHFVFVEKSEDPDISFRRVGVNAGTIDINIDEKSVQSHYFIKFTNGKSRNDNIKQLSKITYEFNNTVGPKSISKQELIKEFNKVL